MFANLKIGIRLGMGFGIVVLLLIVISTMAYQRLGTVNAEIEGLMEDKFPKTVQANNVIDAINAIARLLRNGYIYSGDEQKRALDGIAPQRKVITENLEKLEKSIHSDKGKEKLKAGAAQ